jgi:hypothetical protein
MKKLLVLLNSIFLAGCCLFDLVFSKSKDLILKKSS